MNERKAVKYHALLVAALREAVSPCAAIGTTPAGFCKRCGLRSCAEHRALLAELDAEGSFDPHRDARASAQEAVEEVRDAARQCARDASREP